MSTHNGTIIDLTVTTAYVLMSVDTTMDDYVLKIAPVDTPISSCQPSAANSSSSISIPRTSSTSKLSPSDTLADDLPTYYKIHQMIE